MSDLQIFDRRIDQNDLFNRDPTSFLLCFKDAFSVEIKYLKSAYVANNNPPKSNSSPSPSEILLNQRYKEIDRTFTGIMALYWIYHRDYENFTHNQPRSTKLSESSFQSLCAFFYEELDDFQNSKKLRTLIIMQVTNDLGKSDQLKEDLIRINDGKYEINHDMLMHHVLQYHSYLVPSIRNSPQRALIDKLIQLASEHNPGQLVQGESPPALLDILHEVGISVEDFRLKYLENFLDVSGAYGHIDHEGAFTMTETVFQAYDYARRISEDVILGGSTEAVWRSVLRLRLQILKDAGWQDSDMLDLSDPQHRAKARLLCMARATRTGLAEVIIRAFDQILDHPTRDLLTAGLNRYGTVQDPAVLPTYMPEMFRVLTDETATSSVETQEETFAAIMSYLARVLDLTDEDRAQIEEGVVVVEREVKHILKPLIESDGFLTEPWLVLHKSIELPLLQIARKLRLR